MKASTGWFGVSAVSFILACLLGIIGVSIEYSSQKADGLYMVIISTFVLAFTGICVTLGAKYESEEKSDKRVRKQRR